MSLSVTVFVCFHLFLSMFLSLYLSLPPSLHLSLSLGSNIWLQPNMDVLSSTLDELLDKLEPMEG